MFFQDQEHEHIEAIIAFAIINDRWSWANVTRTELFEIDQDSDERQDDSCHLNCKNTSVRKQTFADTATKLRAM